MHYIPVRVLSDTTTEETTEGTGTSKEDEEQADAAQKKKKEEKSAEDTQKPQVSCQHADSELQFVQRVDKKGGKKTLTISTK